MICWEKEHKFFNRIFSFELCNFRDLKNLELYRPESYLFIFGWNLYANREGWVEKAV